MEIDYKANAVHALNVLMKHGTLKNQERAILEFVSQVLSEQVRVQNVTMNYNLTLRELNIQGYEPIKNEINN